MSTNTYRSNITQQTTDLVGDWWGPLGGAGAGTDDDNEPGYRHSDLAPARDSRRLFFIALLSTVLCMLRTSHWMPSNKHKALLSFLSARFSACLSWPFVPQPVQHRPHLHHQRCCATSGVFRLRRSSSGHRIHVDDGRRAGTLSSNFDRLPTLVLANDRKEGQPRQQRRGLFAAGSPSSSPPGPLMAGPVVAAGGAGDVEVGKQEKKHEEEEEAELVLDRKFFSKETTVVAVKLPAKRTR